MQKHFLKEDKWYLKHLKVEYFAGLKNHKKEKERMKSAE